ncbi:MAG: cyclase family protein [Chthoniobacterales bacterium]
MRKIYDISRTLSAELPPWPGDVPFRYQSNGRIAQGSSVNLGSINMSLHNGTHGDANYHFDDAGWTMEQALLEVYLGPALVVDLSTNYAGGARPQFQIADFAEHAAALEQAPRLLVKTNVWADPRIFPPRIPTLAAGVPEWLQARGVKLLGLDLPSVDAIEAKQLVNHHALGAAKIHIIESLDLSEIAGGRYHFVALPLKIAGGDGSPVRAILWRDE